MLNENTIPQVNAFPPIFRVASTSCLPATNGKGVEYKVKLYHDDVQMTVSYSAAQPDIRLKVDHLVSVRWKLPIVYVEGAIQISRLVLLEKPVKGFNIFETVPPRWVKDRTLIHRAKQALDALPTNLHQLITAVLWDGKRFCRFCVGPSSIEYLPALKNENLLHTVQVTEIVKLISPHYPTAHQGIALASALLHDVGKAAGYTANARDVWELSERGRYVGNRYTVIEWITEARSTNRIMISDKEYLSLVHSLISAPNTEWLGFLPPVTEEARILDVAMRLSDEPNMISLLRKHKELWGTKHITSTNSFPNLQSLISKSKSSKIA